MRDTGFNPELSSLGVSVVPEIWLMNGTHRTSWALSRNPNVFLPVTLTKDCPIDMFFNGLQSCASLGNKLIEKIVARYNILYNQMRKFLVAVVNFKDFDKHKDQITKSLPKDLLQVWSVSNLEGTMTNGLVSILPTNKNSIWRKFLSFCDREIIILNFEFSKQSLHFVNQNSAAEQYSYYGSIISSFEKSIIKNPFCNKKSSEKPALSQATPPHSKYPKGHLINQGANQGRAGNCQNPRHQHLLRHTPTHRPNPLRRADAHDGSRNDVRCAYRQMKHRRRKNDEGRIEVGGETADGLQFENLAADGFDDAPTAHRRAQRHGCGRQNFHRRGHLEHIDIAAGQKRQRDDAHGFLCVVRSVGKRHHRRRDNLHPFEAPVHDIGRGFPKQEIEEMHHKIPGGYGNKRRQHQGQHDFPDADKIEPDDACGHQHRADDAAHHRVGRTGG